MNTELAAAVERANANGHVLVSDHMRGARRWSCAVCDLSVILRPNGQVKGWAQSTPCRSVYE